MSCQCSPMPHCHTNYVNALSPLTMSLHSIKGDKDHDTVINGRSNNRKVMEMYSPRFRDPGNIFPFFVSLHCLLLLPLLPISFHSLGGINVLSLWEAFYFEVELHTHQLYSKGCVLTERQQSSRCPVVPSVSCKTFKSLDLQKVVYECATIHYILVIDTDTLSSVLLPDKFYLGACEK